MAQALVPDMEHPYRVPENWCWTYIHVGFSVTSSKRVHKSDWLPDGIPFYRTRELVKLSEYGYVENDLYISRELYENYKKNYGVPKVGDLLISGVGTIGVPFIVKDNQPFYFKDGNIIWFQNKEVFLPSFIYYLYKSEFMYNQIHAMSAGTTVDTYTIINTTGTMLPLPPHAEQQRIVDRIESLFAKLDEAKEKAQAVMDGFEDRRAAILHKAFTGELTAEWRKDKGVSLQEWIQSTYGELGESKLGKMLDREKNNGRPVPYLRNVNVRWFGFDLSDISTMLASDEEIQNLRVEKGDLFICEGGEPGRCAMWQSDESDMIFQKALHRFRPYGKVKSEYLCYYIFYLSLSNSLEKYFTGTTIKHLTGQSLAKIPIMLPSISEQEKIISIIDDLLSAEQQAEESAKQVIDQIDTMKKSILARAFRGELGTNDPADEPAIELLKRIL